MATTENAWRELPTEVLEATLTGARLLRLDQCRFHTVDWGPSALRLVPIPEVEAELVARGRCD